MTDSPVPPRPRWPAHVRRYLQDAVIDTDDHVDRLRMRLRKRLGHGTPRHIATHVGHGDATRVTLMGRVLAERPQGGPTEDDGWWDNLLNTYRRFESDEVPDVDVTVRFRGAEVQARTNHEGYYEVELAPTLPADDALWAQASVSAGGGAVHCTQAVLQVKPDAGIGLISDIDDTVLHSGITDWKTAAQLTFLNNARTRKPLKGVAALYKALQAGRNPLFYVSSSPWNLHDLLEDFMELNAIPAGPIFLRDIGTDAGKFLKTAGHGHKLERARTLINRYPHLRWVLLGDSGQHDAELYAEAAREFGDRIAAIYIRDVDPAAESRFDAFAKSHIERIAGTGVPMLLAGDSMAMAEHAATLGLVDAAALPAIAREVGRDAARPTLGEAAADSAVVNAKNAAKDTVAEVKATTQDAADAAKQGVGDAVGAISDAVTGKGGDAPRGRP